MRVLSKIFAFLALLSFAPVGAAFAEGVKLTAEDVSTWLDGFMPYAIKRGAVAGAVVTVVKDGQVLAEKGYGYADVAKLTPVDPKTTMFRPGSTSKLFTWTAVMQQVEQGKLDLDADINKYLDFTVPPRDGKPITLRNIMTHTAGFEESIKGLILSDPKLATPLGETVKRWTPERIFAPGSTPAYSNYATALAGYIVERVSGEPFATYVNNHIFTPLQMTHSSFEQPLPEAMQPDMAQGYPTTGSPAKPFELIPLAPAGSLSASGDDMTRFMIAHLQNGKYGNVEILKPETAQMMHNTALDVIPHLNRMELGFYEDNINGHRVIGHAGDTVVFHTFLWLYPDDNIGVFVSMNSAGREGSAHPIREALFQAFSDRYLPGDNPTGKVEADKARADAALISGLYQNSRRPQSNFLSVLGLLAPTKVHANADGTISVSGINDLGSEPKHYREIGPMWWQEVNGHGYLSAVVADGKVTRFSVSEISPFMLFEPYPAGSSPGWLRPAALVSIGALLLTVIVWPIAALIRRGRGLEPRYRSYHWIRIADLTSLLLVCCWSGLVLWLVSGGLDKSMHIGGALLALQLATVVVLIGGVLVGLLNIKILWGGVSGWFSKCWSVVQLASLAVLLWTALAYHLISFSQNF